LAGDSHGRHGFSGAAGAEKQGGHAASVRKLFAEVPVIEYAPCEPNVVHDFIQLLLTISGQDYVIKAGGAEKVLHFGSKVTQTLVRSSLVMFLSVVRLRLIYSPFYPWLRKLLGPLEGWLYKKLRAPRPRSGSLPENKNHKDDKNGKDKKDKNNDRA